MTKCATKWIKTSVTTTCESSKAINAGWVRPKAPEEAEATASA